MHIDIDCDLCAFEGHPLAGGVNGYYLQQFLVCWRRWSEEATPIHAFTHIQADDDKHNGCLFVGLREIASD
jgi:hypothetical protein